MSEHNGNVAFKCTYNDGGSEGFVGFEGTCSLDNIKRNVKGKHGRRWCSSPSCLCRQMEVLQEGSDGSSSSLAVRVAYATRSRR